MSEPQLPLYVDATIMSAFRSCHQKMFLQHMKGLQPGRVSIDLHAGGAIAHALEHVRHALWDKKLGHQESLVEGFKAFVDFWGEIEAPEGHNKTFDRCAAAFVAYFNHFGFDTDPIKPVYFSGRSATELSFSIPMPVNHPSGEPFLWCGRLDFLGEFEGQPWLVDEKTSKSLGASWLKQWDLRSQFIGYNWAMRQQGIEAVGVITRGTGLLKTDITFMQAINRFSNELINRWFDQTCRDLEKMVECYKSGYWDYNFDSACNEYGGCMYKIMCKSANPGAWENTFTVRHWDPMAKDPTHSLQAYRALMEAHKSEEIVWE